MKHPSPPATPNSPHTAPTALRGGSVAHVFFTATRAPRCRDSQRSRDYQLCVGGFRSSEVPVVAGSPASGAFSLAARKISAKNGMLTATVVAVGGITIIRKARHGQPPSAPTAAKPGSPAPPHPTATAPPSNTPIRKTLDHRRNQRLGHLARRRPHLAAARQRQLERSLAPLHRRPQRPHRPPQPRRPPQTLTPPRTKTLAAPQVPARLRGSAGLLAGCGAGVLARATFDGSNPTPLPCHTADPLDSPAAQAAFGPTAGGRCPGTIK